MEVALARRCCPRTEATVAHTIRAAMQGRLIPWPPRDSTTSRAPRDPCTRPRYFAHKHAGAPRHRSVLLVTHEGSIPFLAVAPHGRRTHHAGAPFGPFPRTDLVPTLPDTGISVADTPARVPRDGPELQGASALSR
jgi:hypothetical protein